MGRAMRLRSRIGLASALAALGLLIVVTSGFAGANGDGEVVRAEN